MTFQWHLAIPKTQKEPELKIKTILKDRLRGGWRMPYQMAKAATQGRWLFPVSGQGRQEEQTQMETRHNRGSVTTRGEGLGHSVKCTATDYPCGGQRCHTASKSYFEVD